MGSGLGQNRSAAVNPLKPVPSPQPEWCHLATDAGDPAFPYAGPFGSLPFGDAVAVVRQTQLGAGVDSGMQGIRQGCSGLRCEQRAVLRQWLNRERELPNSRNNRKSASGVDF